MLRYLDTAIGFAVIMLLLSLLVTTLVQSAIALLNLRGGNLKWGLKVLFEQIAPEISPGSRKDLAEHVLKHPAVASTGLLGKRRWAVAIRVEELYNILRHLSEHPPEGMKEPIQRLLKTVPAEAARVEKLATDLAAVVPVQATILHTGMMQVLAKESVVVRGVSDWFDTIMDRTSQRFAMYTRYLCVAAAVMLTVTLRLDTPGVLNRIWSNAALREQLVTAGAPLALRMADSVRAYQNTQKTLASLAIGEVADAQKDTALKRILGGAPPSLGTLREGDDWLAGALEGRRERDSVLRAYRQHMAGETDSLLNRYRHSSQEVRNALADTAIGIFQTPLQPLREYWLDADHAVRGLISIVLLSLGAPFWYKVLKQAAALRPALAQKVEEETKAKGG